MGKVRVPSCESQVSSGYKDSQVSSGYKDKFQLVFQRFGHDVSDAPVKDHQILEFINCCLNSASQFSLALIRLDNSQLLLHTVLHLVHTHIESSHLVTNVGEFTSRLFPFSKSLLGNLA